MDVGLHQKCLAAEARLGNTGISRSGSTSTERASLHRMNSPTVHWLLPPSFPPLRQNYTDCTCRARGAVRACRSYSAAIGEEAGDSRDTQVSHARDPPLLPLTSDEEAAFPSSSLPRAACVWQSASPPPFFRRPSRDHYRRTHVTISGAAFARARTVGDSVRHSPPPCIEGDSTRIHAALFALPVNGWLGHAPRLRVLGRSRPRIHEIPLPASPRSFPKKGTLSLSLRN